MFDNTATPCKYRGVQYKTCMEGEMLWLTANRALTPLHGCAKEMKAAGASWSPPSDPGTAGCRPRPLSWVLGIVIIYLLMMSGANCSSKLESWYFQALAGMNLKEINVLALTKYFYNELPKYSWEMGNQFPQLIGKAVKSGLLGGLSKSTE